MKEYKIIEGTPIECQKWLNQWRHEFDIEIISQTAGVVYGGPDVNAETWVVITLTMEKKNVQLK